MLPSFNQEMWFYISKWCKNRGVNPMFNYNYNKAKEAYVKERQEQNLSTPLDFPEPSEGSKPSHNRSSPSPPKIDPE